MKRTERKEPTLHLDRHRLGVLGEEKAAVSYREDGYDILDANYHCRFGEIDLVAQNKKNLVFVEVKTRKNANFAAASDYVDRRKQDKLRITASIYLSKFPTALQPRFDVIEVYTESGQINHIENAFE